MTNLHQIVNTVYVDCTTTEKVMWKWNCTKTR
ncbi:hypothetical protein UVIVOLLU_CDS0005 [Salmonella phage PHA46_2]